MVDALLRRPPTEEDIEEAKGEIDIDKWVAEQLDLARLCCVISFDEEEGEIVKIGAVETGVVRIRSIRRAAAATVVPTRLSRPTS